MGKALRIERSAGGFVVRRTSAGTEVLLIDDAYGKVSFPKGHLESGETWEAAAIRETLEETGIEARILNSLGRVEYLIERDGHPVRKQVRIFLMEVIDEADEPRAQEAELRNAYFRPWAEAVTVHDQNGYSNWNWIFDKAAVLLDWHDGHYESKWRNIPASTPAPQLQDPWHEARPMVERILQAVKQELLAVAPEQVSSFSVDSAEVELPITIVDEQEALRQAIEHTLLRPEASAMDIAILCSEAVAHEFRAVCVNPQHIGAAVEAVQGTSVTPCVVVGFPLGAADKRALQAETRAVVDAGAREVDMVIPIGSMREDDTWTVFEHVQTVCEAAHSTPGTRVKVIVEAHFLSYDQLAKACIVSLAAGADFVKTSTGFAPSGAKLADVALMARVAGVKAGVKAAGGIRSRLDALNFIRYGAARIGTSSGVSIVRE